MLSSTFPYPPTRGGTQVRTFNLLKYLSEHHDITMMTQSSENITDEEVEVLRELVAQLVVFPKPAKTEPEKGILKRVQ
ncbi:MAG: glycosyl transferase family 1, partial [Merismopedia sp. SIO2A8]|nr:glycosyl transferase family 1 [Merismopedia sp. SIO2A8]